MARLRWTPQAADDLEAIADFIAHDSTHYARLFVLTVLAAIERLPQFPGMGRMVPEANNPLIKELITGNYRIIYRLNSSADLVEILTIYHGSRILDPKVLE